MKLSERVRENCECAPWVLEEIIKLENDNASLKNLKKEEGLSLIAFWKYDQFPYLLWGNIKSFKSHGKVTVRGYQGMIFKPEFILTQEEGEKLARKLDSLKEEYDVELENLRDHYNKEVEKLLLEIK